MTSWYASRRLNRSAKAVIGLAVLAFVLVAAVPVAFFAGVLLMIFGHVVGGLALFGGSVLLAGAAVALAAFTGVHQVRRHVRDIVATRDLNVLRLPDSYLN
jgi:hypothetical protein